MITTSILWTAEQVCGECGAGMFFKVGPLALAECSVCQHLHPMNAYNLDENERFEWIGGTLHVVAYDVTEED
jgi:hypothetical protein